MWRYPMIVGFDSKMVRQMNKQDKRLMFRTVLGVVHFSFIKTV